jgi:hypothetical protein
LLLLLERHPLLLLLLLGVLGLLLRWELLRGLALYRRSGCGRRSDLGLGLGRAGTRRWGRGHGCTWRRGVCHHAYLLLLDLLLLRLLLLRVRLRDSRTRNLLLLRWLLGRLLLLLGRLLHLYLLLLLLRLLLLVRELHVWRIRRHVWLHSG